MFPEEQRLKERAGQLAEKQAALHAYENQAQGSAGGGLSASTLDCCNGALRDRIAIKLDHAQRASRKAVRLEELAYLLDKHPEVARILDLMEDA